LRAALPNASDTTFWRPTKRGEIRRDAGYCRFGQRIIDGLQKTMRANGQIWGRKSHRLILADIGDSRPRGRPRISYEIFRSWNVTTSNRVEVGKEGLLQSQMLDFHATCSELIKIARSFGFRLLENQVVARILATSLQSRAVIDMKDAEWLAAKSGTVRKGGLVWR
jgi:hypothetical protein